MYILNICDMYILNIYILNMYILNMYILNICGIVRLYIENISTYHYNITI